jgi:hypothetical protein
MSLGKANNAAVRPSGLGTQLQSSTYGSVIPTIIGRTRTTMSLIWCNNLQQHGGSGKKGKAGGGKKGSATTYTEAVDFLLGSNPIVSPLQIWADQDQNYLLNFTAHTSICVSGGSETVSFVDNRFYCILGVSLMTKYDVTFDDYGGGGPQEFSNLFDQTPLWNAATAGPDPTNPTAYRKWPFCFYWLPGSGPSIKIPAIPLGLFDPFVNDPGYMRVTIYYAQLQPGKQSPVAQLRLGFEPQLGEGNEYSGFEDQQLIYPPFAGLGSPNLDLGGGGLIPNIRLEVVGSFPYYSTGDAEHADMVEDIFKAAQAQAAYGLAQARTSLQRGLQCYEFPGATQKKAYACADGTKSPMQAPVFDLGCGSGVLLAAASAASGWSAAATISDDAGHVWNALVPDQRSAQRQIWYALPDDVGNAAIDPVALNLAGANADLQLLEISGLDSAALDAYQVYQSTGSGGQTSLTGSITTTNDPGKPAYIVAWVFSASPMDPTKWKPRTPLKVLIAPQTGSLQRSDYAIVRNPGTYSFTYDLAGTMGDSQEWTLVLVALKATQPASYAKPLQNILDDDTLDLCRLQCRANGLKGSLCMDSQKKASDWLGDIYTAMNAAPVWSGFRLKSIPLSEVSAVGNGAVYTAPTASGPVVDLGESDFVADPGQPMITIKHKARVDSPNLLQMQHPNRASNYVDINTSDPYAGSIANYGTRKSSPVVNRTVQDDTIARMLLGIMTRRQNVLRNDYQFTLQGRWKLLEAMDLVTISDSILGLYYFPVRLKEANENKEHDVECIAEPFVYGLHAPIEASITDHVPYDPGKLHVPDSVNAPAFIEAVAGMEDSPTGPELWIGISDADPLYGACQVYVSTDGGTSYKLLGSAIGNAVTGAVQTEWPGGQDPDTTNDLHVDLTESLGALLSYGIADEDAFVYPCYVEGGSAEVPYEVMSYAVADPTGANKYALKATGGGNHLRRGAFFTAIADHPVGKRFVFLDPTSKGIFKFALDPTWIGQTLYFKFPAINKYGFGLQDLSDCTAYPFTPLGIWKAVIQTNAPDQIWRIGVLRGDNILFGCLARKNNADVDEAEFRASLVPIGTTVDHVDMRLPAEGGTFVPDGVTKYSVTGIKSTWAGAHWVIFFTTHRGQWYYTFRLHSQSGGWSNWTEGNLVPQYVVDYVNTEQSSLVDSGPPAGWTVQVIAGPIDGTCQVVASRPATNGHRIPFVEFQVRDASSSGAWRGLDEDAGAAATYYDGSGVSHTYDPVNQTLTRDDATPFGLSGDKAYMLIYDQRAGLFNKQYCDWGGLSIGQVSGSVISGLTIQFSFAPTGGLYHNVRIKIIRAPWDWNDSNPTNDDGFQGINGYNGLQLWDQPSAGDLSSRTFTSAPFQIPAGKTLQDMQGRVWFANYYSFSDDATVSPSPSPDAPTGPSFITYLTDAPVVNVDCSQGPLFKLKLTGNHALGTLTNMYDGELIGIVLQQDVVGTRTFSLASSTPSVRFGTQVKSSDYVLSTTPGAQDYLILCYCAADNVFDVVSFTPGYGA